jgi:hypothetical protein
MKYSDWFGHITSFLEVNGVLAKKHPQKHQKRPSAGRQ